MVQAERDTITKRPISRREALKKGGIAGLLAALSGTLAAAQISNNEDTKALTAARDWHLAWKRVCETELYVEQHPELLLSDRYCETNFPQIHQQFNEARGRLLACEPHTLAGALAVMGCAMTVCDSRRRAREVPTINGTVHHRVSSHVFMWQGEERMLQIAHAAIQRLAKVGAA
jgi:hypothetical protein